MEYEEGTISRLGNSFFVIENEESSVEVFKVMFDVIIMGDDDDIFGGGEMREEDME